MNISITSFDRKNIYKTLHNTESPPIHVKKGFGHQNYSNILCHTHLNGHHIWNFAERRKRIIVLNFYYSSICFTTMIFQHSLFLTTWWYFSYIYNHWPYFTLGVNGVLPLQCVISWTIFIINSTLYHVSHYFELTLFFDQVK